MAALSPAIRSGPLPALVLAFALATPAGARDAGAAHHFSVYGSLTPSGASTPAAGGAIEMHSHLGAPQMTVVEQAGGNFVMNAKVAAQPLGCAGDTIFANGFDP